jgi:hypothetical protein
MPNTSHPPPQNSRRALFRLGSQGMHPLPPPARRFGATWSRKRALRAFAPVAGGTGERWHDKTTSLSGVGGGERLLRGPELELPTGCGRVGSIHYMLDFSTAFCRCLYLVCVRPTSTLFYIFRKSTAMDSDATGFRDKVDTTRKERSVLQGKTTSCRGRTPAHLILATRLVIHPTVAAAQRATRNSTTE